MALSGFDRWLTTNRAAEDEERMEEAWEAYASKAGFDMEDRQAHAEWEASMYSHDIDDHIDRREF